MIVVTDENKDQINSALTVKLLDFDINIPSMLHDIKLLDLDKLNDASADVSNKLNVDAWFNNTIACMDISAGCQGCNETQTDFGDCKGGCFGINTGCKDCEGTDAVPVCTSCDNGESCEQAPTVIEVCTSCDEGCFVCDSACFRCDGGCQGGQTCHSCNNGEGCTVGCENNFHAGCGSCELDFQLCDSQYQPPCGREQAVIQCQSACNTGCVGNDIDYCKEEHLVCEGDQSQICDEHQQLDIPVGCANGNRACNNNFAGTCSYNYSSNGSGSAADVSCPGTYISPYSCTTCVTASETCTARVSPANCGRGYDNCNNTFGITNCPSGYKSTTNDTVAYTGETTNCPNNFSQTDKRPITTYCNSGYNGKVCYSDIDSSTHCQNQFNNGSLTCVSDFVEFGDNNVECLTNFVVNPCRAGVAACTNGYKSENGNITCVSDFHDADKKCDGGYSTNGTEINCPSNYKDASGTDCPANYGQDPQVVCTNCNGGRNRVCTSCDTGQPPDCPGCFGMTDNANCQSGCVLGQPDTCDANCVTVGNGGCTDCEGCDSGCNNNVSCDSTFRYDENGEIDCKVTYTDTSCGQTCVNGFNSGTDCFQCVVCDSSCENCEVSCQGGCQNCEIGCQTYCEAVCQSCEGGCNTACVGCDSTCNTSCYSGCDSCDGACDINCENCQGECIIGVGECTTMDGCISGEAICAGIWCGNSQSSCDISQSGLCYPSYNCIGSDDCYGVVSSSS